jgi:hypothetical protein
MESPYKGLVPYAEEDFEYFFGRETEQRIISANLRASRLTLLYGESGVGKSSLLNAGVTHELRQDPDFVAVIFYAWQVDPVVGLKRAITTQIPSLSEVFEPMSYPNLTQGMRTWLERRKGVERPTLLLILDQFENFFQYHSPDSANPMAYRAQSFAQQLPQMIAAEDLPLNFLISIREDSLAGLDRFKDSIPGLFNNYLRVEHLSIAGAKDAILKPLNKFKELHPSKAINMADEKLADVVVQQIIDAQGDRGERVQAASLQLVMTRWWERESEKKSKKMRKATLVKLGNARNIVASYFDEALRKLDKQDTEICFHLVDKLVTSTGRRTVQTFRELTEGTAYGSERVRKLLGNLVDARILTPVPAPKGALPGELSYEFAHDLMAKAATQSLQRYKEEQKLERVEREKRKAEREATEARARAEEMERLQQELEKARSAIFDPPRKNAEEMKRRPPTEKTVTQLQPTVDELKKTLREVVWERSAILGPPQQSDDWPEVVVLMPFTERLQRVYKVHIKRVAARLKMRVGRADDLFGAGPIMKDIWSAIHAARLIIADCTGRDPNVFYEIGLAHAIGRHTILISQSSPDIPFDLHHLRIILYEYTPRGMQAFERALLESMRKSI